MTRSAEAGYFASAAAARRGRGCSSPPQLGQRPCNFACAQSAQKVHSNEQISASLESGGKSRLQHSQLGRSCNIPIPHFLSSLGDAVFRHACMIAGSRILDVA